MLKKYHLEILEKLLLTSPFLRRGNEGVGSFNSNLLIFLNPLNPPFASWYLLLVTKGEVKNEKTKNFSRISLYSTLLFFCFFSINTLAATPVYKIELRNHLFIPSQITIPENTKVKLLIYNHDETDEEFESFELNREKVIIGKRKGVIFIGPLPAGEYPFFGEFFPKTAKGKVIVE